MNYVCYSAAHRQGGKLFAATLQVCLNLNVLLRAATQAFMVLGFMFSASW